MQIISVGGNFYNYKYRMRRSVLHDESDSTDSK